MSVDTEKIHRLIKQAIKHRRSKEDIKETFVAVDYALEKMREQNIDYKDRRVV